MEDDIISRAGRCAELAQMLLTRMKRRGMKSRRICAKHC